jgi:hypothetical protein
MWLVTNVSGEPSASISRGGDGRSRLLRNVGNYLDLHYYTVPKPSKYSYKSSIPLKSVISQERELFINTAVRTSNPTTWQQFPNTPPRNGDNPLKITILHVPAIQRSLVD